MTNAATAPWVLSIEHDQRIDLKSDGTAVRGYETYVREYIGMIESGLMARLSNAAYKILHALALRARILGDPRRNGAEEEFQELERLGIVTQEEKGLLFCFPSRERLMQDTGMGSLNTVDSALDELANLQIVKRITPTQPRLLKGLFGANVYLIHPESFIGKFGASNGEQKLLSEDSDGVQKLHPAEGTECSLRYPVNRALKNKERTTTTTALFESTQIASLAEFYARAIGAGSYTPTEKESRLLVALLQEGFSTAQIEYGITRAVASARHKNRTANLSLCARFVRHPESQDCESEASDSKSSGEIVTDVGKSSAQIVTAEGTDDCGHPAGSKSSGEIVTDIGKSSTQIVPVAETTSARFEELSLDAATQSELGPLVALLEEHAGQPLSKALVRRWVALADEFQALATERGVTPLVLVRQAVEEALDAGSANKGFCAPKMARAILTRWVKESAKEARKQERASAREIPPAVQVYRQVRRRFPAQELWEEIAQTVGTEESVLAFWREVLQAWVGRGYNPLNVAGPLEWFRAHDSQERQSHRIPIRWVAETTPNRNARGD